MLGRTHLLFGLVLAFACMKFFSLPYSFLLFVLFGSLFPDLDHPGSLISGLNFVFKDVSKIVKRTIGHRTYLHTIESGFLFSLLFAPVFGYFGFSAAFSGIGFFVGFAGHLFLDSLTKSGVPLTFKGVNKHKRYGLHLFRTGSVEENWFFVFLTVFLFFYIIILQFDCM